MRLPGTHCAQPGHNGDLTTADRLGSVEGRHLGNVSSGIKLNSG